MHVLKRHLAGAEGGDLWQLCFDPEKGSLHVEHSWTQPAANLAPGQPDQRLRGYALSEFLCEDGPGREEPASSADRVVPEGEMAPPECCRSVIIAECRKRTCRL